MMLTPSSAGPVQGADLLLRDASADFTSAKRPDFTSMYPSDAHLVFLQQPPPPPALSPPSVASSISSAVPSDSAVPTFLPCHRRARPPPGPPRPPVLRPSPTYIRSTANVVPQPPSDKDYARLFVCQLCRMVYSSKLSLQHHLRVHSRIMNAHQWMSSQTVTVPDQQKLFEASHKAAEQILEDSKESSSVSSTNETPETPDGSCPRKGSKRPFSCDHRDCGKRFVTLMSLQRHHRVHSVERPFPCPVCLQRFGTLSHQKRHMRTHTGERPFMCDECGQSFSTSASLKRHRALPFCCNICFKRFSIADGLERHLFKHQ